MEAVVEYEYKAEQEDELTLKVGDVITGVLTADGGWWEGELNGKKGMFPENFVKLIKRRDVPEKKDQKRAATQRKSVRVLAEQFKSDGIPMGIPPKKKEKKKMCKVLFDYKKENDDELELSAGDLVEFHKEVEEGWWEGTLNGKHGVFPSNFVEMTEDATGSSEESTPAPAVSAAEDKNKTEEAKSSNSDFQAIKGKKVVGVGLGNIFGGGPIKLRPTGDRGVKNQDASKPAKSEPESAPEVTKREKQSTPERAVVRFSYSAEQPDELSLLEGQLVRIIEKNLEDDGWWKGEVNGKVGVFPDNFVELLPPEEPNKPKKPPPPTAASKHNLHSKLPTGDSVDDSKKPDSAAPAIGKKPQPPPPIGKKPGSVKIEPSRPAVMKSTSKDNNTDDRSTSEGTDGTHFNDLETSSQKLTHLTANRAKGPKKRPPSTVLNLNDIDKDGDSVDEAKPNSHQPTERSEKPTPVQPPKDNKHPPSEPEPPSLSQPQPPHTVHPTSAVHRDSLHSGGSAPPRPPEPVTVTAAAQSPSSNNAQTNKLIEQLQQEIAELRASAVSKSAFNELKADYERLKADFETMRAANSKKFRDLINEVDEEKKLRLTTQVEIERVKKFMAETNV